MDFQQFLTEFNRLKQQYPIRLTHTLRSENAELGDYLVSCQNVYYSFDDADCKDITYIYDSFKALNCCDGDYVVESENCYESVDVLKAYNCTFLNYCTRIYDSHFCANCDDSDHLFGCSNLKYKKYCIFNKQYTEAEYEQRVKGLLQESQEENLREMIVISKRYPVTITHVANSENCDYGNQVFFSKNLYLCFDSAHSENGGYLYDAHHNRNCYDLMQSFHCELCYECVDSARLNNCFYMSNCEDMYDCAFCENCSNSNHLFGCTSIDKKEFCILNRQYSEGEYKEKVAELVNLFHMMGSGNTSS